MQLIFPKRINSAVKAFVITVLFISLPMLWGCGKKIEEVQPPGDQAITVPAPYDMGEPIYYGVVRSSFYITMRDGVKLAVDLYLPEGLPEGEKIPAILWQTRYWRSAELSWPFSIFFDKPGKTVVDFVTRGYAWVAVDVRGSGASYGTRPCPWYKDEIRDGAEIVDWILSQPWSNGKVGATGISYYGTTSEFLVVNKHPAVKAVAPRFTLFDAYTDIAYPGGIHLDWFTQGWHDYNSSLDQNMLPERLKEQLGLLAKLMVKGVRPVDEDDDGTLLEGAVKAHEANWNVREYALAIPCKDDVPEGAVPVEEFSPYSYAADLDASGTVIYSYSGWFDGAYHRAAMRRFLTLKNPQNRLIIGPWSHAGWYSCSPVNYGRPRFNHSAELLKFFDHYLKGEDTGILREKRVHYFTMVEEQWKSADIWPPASEKIKFYLRKDNRLSEAVPSAADGFDSYTVDYTHGTGKDTRWNTYLGGGIVIYPDRSEEDKKLLIYETEPLDRDTEVTGHPIVNIYVSSSADDGAFFVYFEDVAPDGTVTYISEGMLRAMHRKVSSETPPYYTIVPYHSYKRKDVMKLVPGEVTKLTFDVLPTSYLFKKGNRIRIAIAGADKDYFALIPEEPPTIKVFHDKKHASHIVLPVISRKK